MTIKRDWKEKCVAVKYSTADCSTYTLCIEWFVLSMAHRCYFNTWNRKKEIIIVGSVGKYSRKRVCCFYLNLKICIWDDDYTERTFYWS